VVPSHYENSSDYYGTIASVTTKTRSRRPAADECVPSAEALARAFRFLGKRWNAIVLGRLSAGPAGFRELARAIDGISDSVLSDRLADLAAAFVVRCHRVLRVL